MDGSLEGGMLAVGDNRSGPPEVIHRGIESLLSRLETGRPADCLQVSPTRQLGLHTSCGFLRFDDGALLYAVAYDGRVKV